MSFSIGDKVRILTNIHSKEIQSGDIGKIVCLDTIENDGMYRILCNNQYVWVDMDNLELMPKSTKTYKIGKFYDINDKETTNFNFASIVDINLHRENMGIHYSVMSILVRMEDGEVILTKEELENLVDKLNS